MLVFLRVMTCFRYKFSNKIFITEFLLWIFDFGNLLIFRYIQILAVDIFASCV